ncbi:hypothetical protein V2J52_07615 [Georgenia sp. MJ173]|uniref:DUF7927 domain-containing protein n=1 Tax=Georgenia sunbinii TaxID=3117728 RepID=UPI002F26BF36
MSLTLVMGGSSSIASPSSDPPTPNDSEVEALLREAIEADDAAPDSEVVGDDTADVAAPDEEAAAPDDAAAPEGEVAPPASVVDDAPSATADDVPIADDDGADVAPQASDVTPFFVPEGPPGEDEAKLIIRTGGDRTGTGPTSTTVTPLEGATFEFFQTDNPNNLTGGTTTGESCTTDATGACGVFLDLESGTNYFYAVQTDAPAGWIIPTEWAEGTNYRFSTRLGVNSNDSAAERTQFLPQQIPGTAPDPVWASVRPNPTAPPQCGLDMAMVVDLSNSVTDSNDLLAQYKDAATGFVDALTGTPSQIALHTFATNAPANGSSNGGMPLTTVATASGASALTARINGFTATPDNNDGGTNWDRGFHQVAESADEYDVVLFLTDGAPTFHRNAFGTGSTTNIREVNEAILSANAVKATGAQVVLVGIGPAATLPGADIRIPLVSGPVEGTDYFVTAFDELAETLEEIATANCAGTLTVVKEVQEPDGDVVDGGAGWNFTTATAGVTPASATTDATSAVNFEVSYPDDFTRPVTITETPQEGYELAQVDGQNAVCVDTGAGTAVPVTNVGALGFTVDVPAADIISCTVRNAEVPPDYDDLTVTKTALPSFDRDYDWEIEKLAQVDRIEVPAGDDATFTYDVSVTPSAPVDSGFEVTGVISVTNPNDDVTFTGVDVIDTLADLPGSTCTVTGGTDLEIAPGATFEVAYSCTLTGATATTVGTNTATATWDAAAYLGTSGEATTSEPFDFATTAPSVTDGAVVVTDSEIDLADYDDGTQVGNIVLAEDGPAVFTYELDWPGVPGQCVDYPNTATIVNAVGPAIAAVGDIGILAVDDSSTEIVTVCAGLDLDVEKNVVHSFDRTYLWTIDKVADETVVDGDPATGIATFDYTVTATPVLPPNGWTDSAWAMSGEITVTNPNEWLDITADITDAVDVGGGATCAVTDGTDVLVGAGASVTLDYLCTFTAQPAYAGTNTATATWADSVPTPTSSATGTGDVAADAWSVNPVNNVIDVVDDKTDPANPVNLGPATWNETGTPTVFTYSLELPGTPGECVDFTNTAWIAQTQQEATEVVTACLTAPLEVTKTAEASFDRTYLWDITKEVDATTVTVDEETGEAEFEYTVSAVPNGSTDSGWSLDGEISVTNPNTFESATVTVTDAVDVGGGAVCTVADGVDVEIAAGASKVFDYSCTFTGEPDYEGVNTATVVAGGETFSGAADVTFDLDGETDLTVDVVDDQTDPANPVPLGQATWNAAGTPVEFTYSLTHVGVPGECVDFTNTAWLEVQGDDPTAEQTVEVCVEAPLVVTKSADATYDRLYEWDIDKSVDDTDIEVDENGQATFTYTVDAVAEGFTDSGWEMTGTITVQNPNEYDSGSITVDVADVTDVGATCTVDGGTDLTVAPGATEELTYSCTFDEEPDYTGSNTATVTWTNADGDVDGASDTVPVEFVADVVTDETIEVWDDKTDPANPVLLGAATWSDESSHQFSYDVVHQGVGGQCLEFTNTAWLELESGPGDNDSTTVELCVDSPLTHDKTAVSADQLPDGTWQVRYEIDVVNDALFDAVYSLSDTLEFGEGITPESAIWLLQGTATGGAWSGLPDETTTVLATDATIAAGTTHTYVVLVTADVAEGVTGTVPAQCSGDDGTDGGGFLNAATLTSGDLEETARDCVEPAAPSILKTFETLTENDDGTWDVVYTLAVANLDETASVAYDLVDEPAFVSGAVIEGASVVNTAPGDIVTSPDFDAIANVDIVSGQTLAPETTDVYTVTVTVDLSDLTLVEEPGSRECGVNGSNGGRGLFNEATITSGNDDYADEACVPVPGPELDVEKTAVSAIQNADGSWTVTYVVVAANVSSVGALYDLTDTIEFGDGITPTEATWTLADPANAGEWADPATDPTAVLATDRPLAGGETHTYTVVVDATVGAGVIGSDPGQCENYLGEDGGFLNSVILTAHGQEVTDEDCLEPELPDLEKLFGSAVQLPDGTWGVTYTLVVDNSGNDSRAFYDLADAPHFADGVTILDQSVLDVTDGGTPVEIAWDGTSAIVEDVEVAAGDVHTYQVTFNVQVSAGIPADDLECEPGQGGRGFFNSATLTTGPDSIEDDDCGPITESVVPTVTKTVADGSPVLNADGTWTIVYDVLVTTPEANTLVATYDLSDELDFGEGITVLDAAIAAGNADTPDPLGSWTGIVPDIAVTDGEVLLPAGVSHVYTVTVDAAVGEGVIGTEAGECYTGEVPHAGGFLNTVTLTTDGIERTDDACAEPVPAPWTLEKTSDPVSGSTVDPGDVITYTLTATPTGEHGPVGVEVRDNLLDVLEHAAGYGDIVASTGTTSWDGDVLVWDIGTLAETATLTYAVIVDDDAWDVTLVNVATGSGSTPPTCVGDCSTTHITPPEPGKPDLPTTGAQLGGWIAAAFVLTLTGLALTTVRRRRQT